jgi:glycosyltransferase involved in cell wall biosynthesis
MLVLYNPHVDDFLAEPPHFRLLKRRALKKYGHLLHALLARGQPLDVFVDATISAFLPERVFGLLPGFMRRWIARREIESWLRINGLIGKVRIHTDPSAVADGVLLLFAYKAAVGAFHSRVADLARFRVVLAHLSHYFIATREKAENLKLLSNARLAGDADISDNPYFRHFFSWYRAPLVLLPFAVAPRFTQRKDLDQRQPKAIATGTFHNLLAEQPARLYQDFINFFSSSTYHPVRKLVHEHRDELADRIDCNISLFRPAPSRFALFGQLLSRFSVAQKSYFAIDIVEAYNSYRYAIVGEEASGFPALGAFEAMACGCVLIAQPEYYAGYDLTPGTHFVAHDGTLRSIVAAIDALNADPQRAAAIAMAGREFVERYFRQEAAFAAFERDIAALTERG